MLSVKWVSTHEAKTTLFSYHSNYQQTRIHSTSSWWSGPTPPGLYSVWFVAFLWRESPHSRRGWGPADTFGKTSRASGLLSAEKEDTMGTDINSRPDWEKLPDLGEMRGGMTYSSSSASLPSMAAMEDPAENKRESHVLRKNSFCSLSNLVHAHCFWI